MLSRVIGSHCPLLAEGHLSQDLNKKELVICRSEGRKLWAAKRVSAKEMEVGRCLGRVNSGKDSTARVGGR